MVWAGNAPNKIRNSTKTRKTRQSPGEQKYQKKSERTQIPKTNITNNNLLNHRDKISKKKP